MWETAHIPVTAHILCALSKEHGTSIEARGKRASMFQIYGDMTDFVWKRFKENPKARTADKSIVFGDLEKIAFDAIKKGQILIEQRIVERCATCTSTSRFFKESGFLLLVLEGQEYQFPHLTFQEYFAGKYIAKSLKAKGSDDEKQVLGFIQKEKYNEKHDLTISFAMHAFAEGRSQFALRQMLSIIDESPVEVLGIQHFFLKMRVLETVIEEAKGDDLEDILNDKQAVKLTETARQLIERTIGDDLIGAIMVERFQHFPGVLERFPNVLNDTANRVKKMIACTNALSVNQENIKNGLKLIKHSTKESCALIQFVLQLESNNDRYCYSDEYREILCSIAQQMPKHAGGVLPALAKWCVDDSRTVRENAIKATGRVVAAAPQHAGEVLPALANGCVDKDSMVRWNAMEATGRVVAAAPQHAGEVIPALAKWCVDDSRTVRENAIKATGRLVAAAPQHAGEVLPALANGCVNEDLTVRQNAKAALKEMTPETVVFLAMSFLPAYKTDLSFFFAQHPITLDVPTNRKTVTIVLHTTSSQIIGSWSERDFNLYVGFLKRKFDKMFPRLLESLKKVI